MGQLNKRYVSGGIATQFFLPCELHRTTFDIDLDGPCSETFAQYKDFVNSFSGLYNRGYNVSFAKQRGTLDAIFGREDQGMTLQVPRRAQAKFESEKHRLEGELSNSLLVPYAGDKLRVIHPNDISARKIRRLKTFSEDYNLHVPIGITAGSAFTKALNLKGGLGLMNLDPESYARRIAEIRMYSDLTDVLALLSCSESDVNGIRESIKNHALDQRDLAKIDEVFCRLAGV